MRVKSIIVLLAIAFSIFSPLSLHLTVAHGQASIEGFDVCHAGAFALSAGPEAPCVCEPLYDSLHPLQIAVVEINDPLLSTPLTTFQEEHPPKV